MVSVGLLGFCTNFLSRFPRKSTWVTRFLGLSGFFAFFRVFSCFPGHMTTGNLNVKILMLPSSVFFVGSNHTQGSCRFGQTDGKWFSSSVVLLDMKKGSTLAVCFGHSLPVRYHSCYHVLPTAASASLAADLVLTFAYYLPVASCCIAKCEYYLPTGFFCTHPTRRQPPLCFHEQCNNLAVTASGWLSRPEK